jgi:hypothetical protein
LTPSARSANLIAGDGTKNGLSRSEQKTVSATQNNRLTGKAPYKSANFRSLSGGPMGMRTGPAPPNPIRANSQRWANPKYAAGAAFERGEREIART